jgi:hypothetical protein
LSTKSPNYLIRGVEAVVGLLRNKEKVMSKDVEKFFCNFPKLIEKLRSLDPKTIDNLVLKKHRVELAFVAPTFIDRKCIEYKTNSFFASYIAWG